MKNNIIDEYPFHYRHARPNIAVDICSLGIIKTIPNGNPIHGKYQADEVFSNKLMVFIQRRNEAEKWSLPGKYMHFATTPGEDNELKDGELWKDTLERARYREWPAHKEVAGRVTDDCIKYLVPVNDDCCFQVPILDRIDRDPRGRVLSLPIVTFVGYVQPISKELDHVARWVPLSSDFSKDGEYSLGFDHENIVSQSYKQLLIEVQSRPIGLNLVSNNEDFDIEEIVALYSVLFGKKFEKSNIKKQFVGKRVVCSTSKKPLEKGRRRIGERFCFNITNYEEYKKNREFAFYPRLK